MIERISTGIPDLDGLLEGGVPKGSTLLLAGHPGSGKTLFSAHFLYTGAMRGQAGIYVSLSEPRETFLANMSRFGFDFEQLEREGVFKFLELPVAPVAEVARSKEEAVTNITNTVMQEILSCSAQRLVLDSYSALSQVFVNSTETRVLLHTLLSRVTSRMKVTSLILCEIPVGSTRIGAGIEEFVADGVILLRHASEPQPHNTLQTLKMRGTKITKELLPFNITSEGIKLFTKMGLAPIEHSRANRVRTGIPRLDKMTHGGFFVGSSTIVSGVAGVGKTTLGLQFLAKGVRSNQNGLLISFLEPAPQLLRQAKGFGLKTSAGKFTIAMRTIYPEEYVPERLLQEIVRLVEETDCKRFVLDSTTALENVFDRKVFYDLFRRLQILLKMKDITSLFMETRPPSIELGSTETDASALVDNIVILRFLEAKGVVRRAITVLKVRGSRLDNRIYEFKIGKSGIKILRPFEELLRKKSGKKIISRALTPRTSTRAEARLAEHHAREEQIESPTEAIALAGQAPVS